MQKMFGLQSHDVVAISEDGAPRNKRDFLVWSPPFVDPSQPALGKASSIAEATALMRFLMKRGIRAILFCKVHTVIRSAGSPDNITQIRKVCELVKLASAQARAFHLLTKVIVSGHEDIEDGSQ